MRAVELQRSASNIAEVLKESELLAAIRSCRTVGEKQRADEAWTALRAAGSEISAAFSALDEDGERILAAVHLKNLATNEYWDALTNESTSESDRQAELVRLFSRVMFASNHLPALVSLLEPDSAADPAVAVPAAPAQAAIGEQEEILFLKLFDGEERASDPDRVARAIDGIDMLFASCAGLVRKGDSELRLISITGEAERDLLFAGDRETVASCRAVIESIPAAIEKIDPDTEIDLAQLVRSLPVFDDLATLKSLGSYSEADINDLRVSLEQGLMLALESGVVLVTNVDAASLSQTEPVQQDTSDEDYYEHYLSERDRLANSEDVAALQENSAADEADVDKRDQALQQLLRGSDQS